MKLPNEYKKMRKSNQVELSARGSRKALFWVRCPMIIPGNEIAVLDLPENITLLQAIPPPWRIKAPVNTVMRLVE